MRQLIGLPSQGWIQLGSPAQVRQGFFWLDGSQYKPKLVLPAGIVWLDLCEGFQIGEHSRIVCLLAVYGQQAGVDFTGRESGA